MPKDVHFTVSRLWNGDQDSSANGDVFVTLTDQILELSDIEKEGKEQCITLKVEAPFYNDPAPPEPSDKKSDIDSKNDKALMGLWDYEVVEAFFLCSKSEQYLEVEFGPHGHHLVLFLNGRKNIIQECLPIKWEVEIDHEEKRWRGKASIPLDYFPANVDMFNFYSIHGTDNESGNHRVYKSYKALPGDYPDFHRLEFFEKVSVEDSSVLSILKERSSTSAIWKKALEEEKLKCKS